MGRSEGKGSIGAVERGGGDYGVRGRGKYGERGG